LKVDFINSSYRRFFQAHKAEITKAVMGCYERGDFILREEVEKFEKNLADYIGVKYAVAVNSGSDAIRLGLQALGFTDGDACIVPSNTFIASLEEPIHLGGSLELVDVTEDGLCNVDQIEQALAKVPTVYIARRHNVKYVLSGANVIQPVHLYGKVCDMKRIMKLASKHGVPVLEDACQALGASRDGKKAGAWGDAAAFSFIAPKLLGAGGDGGAVVTNRADVYEKLLLLRNHWNINQNALIGHQPKRPETMGWGWNSRMDNVHAAVINIKFKYIDQILARRREIGMMYNEGLKGMDDLIKLPAQQPEQVYQEYVIRINNDPGPEYEYPTKDDFARHMQKAGIELLIRDTTPNHKLPGLGLDHFNLPVTEQMATESVRLPIYPELTNQEVNYVIDAIGEWYDQVAYL